MCRRGRAFANRMQRQRPRFPSVIYGQMRCKKLFVSWFVEPDRQKQFMRCNHGHSIECPCAFVWETPVLQFVIFYGFFKRVTVSFSFVLFFP